MHDEELSQDAPPPMIPLVVDTVRADDDFPMTRLAYWVIEFDLLEGMVLPEELRYASIMTMRAKLGLSLGEYVGGGIIGEPFGLPTQFAGMRGLLLGTEAGPPARITADGMIGLLDRIGETDALSLATASLWLPNETLAQTLEEPTRGDLYRVSTEVFQAALRFKRGALDLAGLQAALADLEGEQAIRFSKEETLALLEWTERQILDMREKYAQLKEDGRTLAHRAGADGGEPR